MTVRKLNEQDVERCKWIEAGATPRLSYIGDTIGMFINDPKGGLFGADIGGVLGGYGQLSHLYGSYGWLEALRVHPDYQRKGLGKALYRRFFEQMKAGGITAAGMYTNSGNAASRSLAELYSLSLKGSFTEYICSTDSLRAGESFDLVRVEADRGEKALAPCYGDCGGFMTVNRTFFPAKGGLGEHFAGKGWLYADDRGSIMVCGFRFQPHKALHIAYIGGDLNKLLARASRLAAASGSAQLTAMVPEDDGCRREFYEKAGFVKTGDFITLWTDSFE